MKDLKPLWGWGLLDYKDNVKFGSTSWKSTKFTKLVFTKIVLILLFANNLSQKVNNDVVAFKKTFQDLVHLLPNKCIFKA